MGSSSSSFPTCSISGRGVWGGVAVFHARDVRIGRTRDFLLVQIRGASNPVPIPRVIPAGRIPNPFDLENEESERPEIFVCRGLREPWPEFWRRLRSFG